MEQNAKRIDEFTWEVPQDTDKNMNVPVRIYANKHIFDYIKRDRTLQQAVNSSTLPGIVKNMLVMPDGHEGYGFPVGGVAAFDAEEGIISPGAIGFDINCLHPETKVYCDNGTYIPISEIREQHLKILDLDKRIPSSSVPILSMKKQSEGRILRIRTSIGREILATGDHPILTQRGMVAADALNEDDKIVVCGLEGIQYEHPGNGRIISESEIIRSMKACGIGNAGNATGQMLNFLKKHGLSNLNYDSEKLPTLIKLLGIIMGDGTIPSMKNGQPGCIQIYGKEEDLKTIATDVAGLGLGCKIYKRPRKHHINTRYGVSEFGTTEYSLHISSTAFSVLMVALGCPKGNKSATEYTVPGWLKNAVSWQKKLFLSTYFGAELSKPMSHNDQNFSEMSFSISKLESLGNSAIQFLIDIKEMLLSLGIKTSNPKIVDGYRYSGVKGQTVGFRLSIHSETNNVIRFLETVGYHYNREKERLASLAAVYTRHLKSVRSELSEARTEILQMHAQNIGSGKILHEVSNDNVSDSFIMHTISGRTGVPRAWNVKTFTEFCRDNEYGTSGFVLDTIKSIEEEEYHGDVFDITMSDHNHNFIANSMVVSNCGVRLIKTNMNVDDVKPKMKSLMDALFRNVPSGVGSKIKLGFSSGDLDKVCRDGVSHVVDMGYGNAEDIDRIEENGCMDGADPDKVSKLAKKRGLNQLGTLGAGNHFLEVQSVGSVMDERLASAYGLSERQVVVMVHTGSRGFGHQVCSDYLAELIGYQKKNNISLVDPQLIYAKTGSKEADNYLASMKSAVNFAFSNRQIITHLIRKSFEETFSRSWDSMGMEILYDLAHNIAKKEEHTVDGKRTKLYVHRKGATRAFGPGRKEIPSVYRDVGQPVIIPGSMGTASYVLAGRNESLDKSFGSSCHGSGRVMSRHQAIREIPASKTINDLDKKGIEFRVRSRKLISEEAAWAYKDVDDVVASVAGASISNLVVRLTPMGVAKG